MYSTTELVGDLSPFASSHREEEKRAKIEPFLSFPQINFADERYLFNEGGWQSNFHCGVKVKSPEGEGMLSRTPGYGGGLGRGFRSGRGLQARNPQLIRTAVNNSTFHAF